jgi:ABC-type sugar transport system permease subunit
VRTREIIGLLPVTLYLRAFTLGPLASTFVLGVAAPGGRITLDYFHRIIDDFQFGEAVVNTLVVTGIGLTLELVPGLAAALALASRPPGRAFFQVLLLAPLGVPTIVSAAVMRSVFGTGGYLNEALLRLGVIRTPVG